MFPKGRKKEKPQWKSVKENEASIKDAVIWLCYPETKGKLIFFLSHGAGRLVIAGKHR